MTTPSLLIIYTGGTIGMIHDKVSGVLHPFNFARMSRHIPVLSRMGCRISSYSFDPLIDSSNVTPAFWVKLATVIEENYDHYDGFVVLHGTDTMAYSASMLSFMLENLNKPVVFTGAQLPLDEVRTDGRDNFINAVEIASARQDGRPVVPEVSICFENKLLRGNRTNKFNAEHFNAFLSVNFPPLAEVGVHIRYNHHLISQPAHEKLKVYKNLDASVGVLKLFPGITRPIVQSVLGMEGIKGVIMETYGAGNAPTSQWFIDTLGEAIARGVTIYNVTQCKGGSVEMGKYETSIILEKLGVVGGYDITTESALAKMMFLLGQDYQGKELADLLEEPLRGELTRY